MITSVSFATSTLPPQPSLQLGQKLKPIITDACKYSQAFLVSCIGYKYGREKKETIASPSWSAHVLKKTNVNLKTSQNNIGLPCDSAVQRTSCVTVCGNLGSMVFAKVAEAMDDHHDAFHVQVNSNTGTTVINFISPCNTRWPQGLCTTNRQIM